MADITMAIVTGRDRDAAALADLLRTWLPNEVTRVVVDRLPAHSTRVVVGTYHAVLGSCIALRSEERRLGKEWSSRWSPYH